MCAEKKRRKESDKMQRKKLLLAVLSIALIVGLVSAALIAYFGLVQTTANVKQAVLVDGKVYDDMPITETIDVAGGEAFCSPHYLESQTSVPVTLQFDTTYSPALTDDEITVTYNVVTTDDDTDFGSQSNEVVGIPVEGLTLDDIFAGDGLRYTYTIVEGGSYDGASPVIAVIDLASGNHIALFPGWGSRTGTNTLQFSETVAADTGGNNLVDFVLYSSDFSVKLYGSVSCGYGDFAAVKADSSGLYGTEIVTRIAIQHQAASTGEKDILESLAFGSESYNFIIEEGVPFTLPPGAFLKFYICYSFDLLIKAGTYNIYTTIKPPP